MKNHTDQSTKNKTTAKHRQPAQLRSNDSKDGIQRKSLAINAKSGLKTADGNSIEQDGTKVLPPSVSPNSPTAVSQLRIVAVDESAPAEILAIKHRVADSFPISPSRPSREQKLGI